MSQSLFVQDKKRIIGLGISEYRQEHQSVAYSAPPVMRFAAAAGAFLSLKIKRLSPRFAAAERAKALFVNRMVRPDPLAVLPLSDEDIVAGTKMAFGDQNWERYKNSLTYQEAAAALPLIEQIIETILKTQHFRKIWVHGRDGEMLYDALRALLAGTPSADDVLLFPGTKDFWGDMHDLSVEKKQAFYGRYGLTVEALALGDSSCSWTRGFLGPCPTLPSCMRTRLSQSASKTHVPVSRVL